MTDSEPEFPTETRTYSVTIDGTQRDHENFPFHLRMLLAGERVTCRDVRGGDDV